MYFCCIENTVKYQKEYKQYKVMILNLTKLTKLNLNIKYIIYIYIDTLIYVKKNEIIHNKIKIFICTHIYQKQALSYNTDKTNFLPEVEDKILTIATCVSESAS